MKLQAVLVIMVSFLIDVSCAGEAIYSREMNADDSCSKQKDSLNEICTKGKVTCTGIDPHPIPTDKPMRLFCVQSRNATGSFMKRNGNEMICNGNESKADGVYTNIQASPYHDYVRLTLADPQDDKKEYVITCNGANKPLAVQHVGKNTTPPKNDESLFKMSVQFYSYNMLLCKSAGGSDKGRNDLYVSSDTQGKTSLAPIVSPKQYPPPNTFIRIVQHL